MQVASANGWYGESGEASCSCADPECWIMENLKRRGDRRVYIAGVEKARCNDLTRLLLMSLR